MFFGVASVVLGLRIFTRLFITERRLLIDDYLALAGWVRPLLSPRKPRESDEPVIPLRDFHSSYHRVTSDP